MVQNLKFPSFYQPYIDILNGNSDVLECLDTSLELFEQILFDIEDEKQLFRYAEGKWTIKELVQHMIDAERVFVYRALRFSRIDENPLSGVDENSYVANYDSNKRDYEELLDEFCLLRRSTYLMFKGFDKETFDLTGTVEGKEISVGALGLICSGHVLHHLKIIQERYL